MLGYMTEKRAAKEGFTHHGSYYGIPLWMNDDEDCPDVCTKWGPMEHVMTAFHYVEWFLNSMLWLNEPHYFMFKKGRKIKTYE